MPKALCLTGLVVAGLVFLLFFLDLLFGLIGMSSLAPFKMASMLMDILFVLCALGLAYLSWATFKQQK
jgi:hypothetical protein